MATRRALDPRQAQLICGSGKNCLMARCRPQSWTPRHVRRAGAKTSYEVPVSDST